MRIVERGSLVDVTLEFTCSNCGTVFVVDPNELKDYICKEVFDGKRRNQNDDQ